MEQKIENLESKSESSGWAAMGFLVHEQTKNLMIKLAIFFLICFFKPSFSQQQRNFPIAKPNCVDHCGNTEIPYPFGTTPDCYQSKSFWVTCNQTLSRPKLFLNNSTIEITDISLDGQLRLLQFISKDCYSKNGTRLDDTSNNGAWISLPTHLIVNSTRNKFTIVGCDTYGFVSGRRLDRNYQTGCSAICYSENDLSQGSCAGLGCCQSSIPSQVWRVTLTLRSYNNYTSVNSFNNCSFGFLVEESAFNFSPENLTNLHTVEKLPMLADWAIGNVTTCEEASLNLSSYACKSINSDCYKPDNGYGYRCFCKKGYQGNPYLLDGCKDMDECKDSVLNICEKESYCKNKEGSFECICPEGYRGDAIKNGKGCIRSELLAYKLAAGVSLGTIVVLLSTCLLYLNLKRRSLNKMKENYFLLNGGLLLQEKLSNNIETSTRVAKIFTSSDLKKATKDFHDTMIIGQGGYGTVFKGFLADNRVVAIKKSKKVDPKEVEQFINEVLVLSQINHKNVVKLLGCCLDTQVPLLVYEYINNGTLSEHLHHPTRARFLPWDVRLKIAAETATVLSYLHSEASTQIIHRDIKPANILLDNNFTAKVADFGASRLVPTDQTQLSTLVQGTLGYLDPEYLQTSLLTEKSDVYSFGVILTELLTGMKALSYIRPEAEKNLSHLFLSKLNQDRLFEIVDDSIVHDENQEQLIEVAMLAKWCINMKGDDRPSMKEVAMKLETLRIRSAGSHSWAQTEQNLEENESFLEDRVDLISVCNSYNNSSMSSIMYNSLNGECALIPNRGR